MTSETKKSVQINLKLEPDRYRELKELARHATIRYDQRISIQLIIRKAIQISFEELKRMCMAA
jgi:hypothetical protein